MDLRDLRYFAAIAASGSMTAAARSLRVSQPTLTVAMQNLESELSTQLLNRERSGVTLTATGEALLAHAHEIFALLDRAEQRVRGLEDEDEGTFVIGANESLAAYFLPAFMAGFLRAHPRVELLISNQSSAAVRASVLDRSVSFGLVVNAEPHPDLVIVELFHDAVDVMVAEDAPPPSRPLASLVRPFPPANARGDGGARGTGEDNQDVPVAAHGDSDRAERAPAADDPTFEAARHRLLAGPLIYAGRVGQAQELCSELATAGLLPDRKLVCGDLELVKSLALAGIGPALLPRRVAAYGHEGKLVRLHPDLPFIPDTISLLYRADMHRTRAAMRVKEALVAHGKQL